MLVIDELNVGTENADSVQLKLFCRFLKCHIVSRVLELEHPGSVLAIERRA